MRDNSDALSPTRVPSGDARGSQSGNAGVQQRVSMSSRRRTSSGVPSVAPGDPLYGPGEIPQLQHANEPFVQPGYCELNPSYEQPVNSKPVWSLAKPLPRVVRPGMVPTGEELLESRAHTNFPTENSQKLGLDVDPIEIEQGRFEKTVDPRKIAAQVEDARQQRERKLSNKILSGDTASMRKSSRPSRTLSGRQTRSSAWGSFPGKSPSTGNEDQGQQRKNIVFEEPGYDETQPLLNIPTRDQSTGSKDVHPLVKELAEDEVHNNHTIWCVIRTHYREALAESLAVFVQLTIGFCADLAVTVANEGNPNTTAWAWGFATMMGIYISGGVSGAHLNPSITIMFWFYRGFPKRKLPEYFLAQFIAAFCAGLVAYGVYYRSIQQHLLDNPDTGIISSFVTSPRALWINPATAFWNEFIGTALLTVTILALGDDQNAPPTAGMNSVVIGFIITCLSMAFAYQTGAALNPSRDFGPRLALLVLGYGRQLFTGTQYWFYGPWAGSLSGSFVGAFLYDFFIFTGGESPVNYPLERAQRVLKKRAPWSN